MLRERLSQEDILTVPGVFDGLSASVAARQDFEALYMSGFAVAASLLALPDIGLVSANEMVARASQIVDAAKGKPVIADGDNGYGGVFNVERLVRSYEKAGVACIQLEDQVNPKRCGHMENKQVVPLEEAAQKIKAAVDARTSSEFLIMARTDARATDDLAEALRRGEAFLEAGADILFIEAPRTNEEMRQIGETFAGVPLVANLVEDGKTPCLSPAELTGMGYKILLRPVSALLAVAKCLTEVYASLNDTAEIESMPRLKFDEMNQLLGLDEYLQRS